MGQTSTQTTTNTIPGAGNQEGQLMALLQKLAQQSGGQLDFASLGKLAKGGVGGPSQEDYDLVQGTIGRTGEMAQREMQRIMGPLLAQMGESQQGRGITGGSIASLDKILAGREMSGRMADILSQSQQQGGQALMNLPFQRAETQMGANQLLFNMLTGAANPVLANALQSRLAQGSSTTKSKQPMGMEGWMKLGALGAAPFTGGASLGMLGMGGMGGGQSMSAPSLGGMSFNPYGPNQG